jgi:short-subunit dehydrogenase
MNQAHDVLAILIFGATGGIGLEVARRLAESGLRLVLASLSQDALVTSAGSRSRKRCPVAGDTGLD